MSSFEQQLVASLGDVSDPVTPPPSTDEDELFFLSLIPSLKRLSLPKKAEVKFKIHKLIFVAGQEDQ